MIVIISYRPLFYCLMLNTYITNSHKHLQNHVYTLHIIIIPQLHLTTLFSMCAHFPHSYTSTSVHRSHKAVLGESVKRRCHGYLVGGTRVRTVWLSSARCPSPDPPSRPTGQPAPPSLGRSPSWNRHVTTWCQQVSWYIERSRQKFMLCT